MAALAVVTGAAGHAGGNLVRALVESGRPVRALVRQDARALAGLPGVEQVRADVLDPASLAPAFRGARTVFHLAGRISLVGDPDGGVWQTNVIGTRNVVAACRREGVSRLIHFSSVHAHDPVPRDEPLDEDRPLVGPGAPAYDRSKAVADGEVIAAARAGLDALVLSPGAILGPHDHKPSRMGEFFVEFAAGRIPALVEGGYHWVDVRDVMAAALRAEERGRTGERYLLAGEWYPVTDLARLWSEVTGARLPRFCCPIWLARAAAPLAVAAARLRGTRPLFTAEALEALRGHRNIRSAKAERELGFRARPLRETLADTWAWWQAQAIRSGEGR